jgi:hypothetical protein
MGETAPNAVLYDGYREAIEGAYKIFIVPL